MRPTFLEYRSPNEKTPEYYNVVVNRKGERLDYRPTSLNIKATVFPQSKRFQTIGDDGQVVLDLGACFTGPGKYDATEAFKRLTSKPCKSVMKKITVLPESESGRSCYYMVGNNLKYEKNFLPTFKERKEEEITECPVSLASTLRNNSISRLRKFTETVAAKGSSRGQSFTSSARYQTFDRQSLGIKLQ